MSRLLLPTLAALALAPAPLAAQRGDTLRLSLPDAVTLALRISDEVRISAAQLDITEAQLGTARANIYPQLRLNSSYNHVWENARANAVGSVFNQPNTYNTNLTLGQTVFQGGRLVSAARAAGETRNASRLDEQEVKAKLSVDVQRGYLQVLFTNQMVDIQTTNLTLASSRLQQVEQLQAAGRLARYDVLRSRVERANIEPLVIQAQNDRDLAMLELKRILNIPFEQPVVLTTRVDASALRVIAVSLDSTSLPDRPALRSAESIVQARRLGIRVARADFLPTASISIQSGYQAFPPLGFGFPNAGGNLGHDFCAPGAAATARCQNGGWFSDRSITATISMPVFDGFRVKSAVELARAQERLAELQLAQTRENVAADVARARAELKRARTTFDARQENTGQAAEAFQLASLRFSRGLSTQLEVSDAQLALLTAQSGEARATYDLYLASAELARSLGRPIPLPPTSVRSTNDGPSK